ncbi:hypothetical protein BDZ97DRAFT_1790641 [Flammula alnicola]|nr:hypothetical protein BDZ97DRAFT_1790641 [Flammula alnicola]
MRDLDVTRPTPMSSSTTNPSEDVSTSLDGPRTPKRTPMACQFCRGKGAQFVLLESGCRLTT